MPIYEFLCNKCDNEFEELVFSSTKVECPECGSKKVKRLVSSFAFGGEGIKSSAAHDGGDCNSCGLSGSACKTCGG